jgi:sRNA-binding regulator protein Hfq
MIEEIKKKQAELESIMTSYRDLEDEIEDLIEQQAIQDCRTLDVNLKINKLKGVKLICNIIDRDRYQVYLSNGKESMIVADLTGIDGFASLEVDNFEHSLEEFVNMTLRDVDGSSYVSGGYEI